MKDKVQLIASFKDLFPGEDQNNFKIPDLIKDIPRDSIIKVMSYLNISLFYNQFSKEFQIHFLRLWTSRFPVEVKKNIEFQARIASLIQNKFLYFFNISTNLRIIELTLENCPEGASADILPEQELEFFKAYLLINQKIQEEQTQKFNTQNSEIIDSLEKLYFIKVLPMIVATGDHVNFKPAFEIFSQMAKGIMLFKYLTLGNKFENILNGFLKNYGVDTWKEYLQSLYSISLTFKIINENQFQYVQKLVFNDTKVNAYKIAQELSINYKPILELKKLDNYSIRIHPLYKFTEKTFSPLSLNFLFNKFFDGIFWELNSLSKESKENFNFLSVIKKEFTEEYLLYSILDGIFKNCFNFSGRYQSDFYKRKYEGDIEKCDYYVRHTKHIYLFECKDNSLASEAKVSQEYEQIDTFLSRPKQGVKQISNSLKELNNKSFLFDDYEAKGIKRKNIVVQPVLVVTDRSLKNNGVNFLLNNELQDQLSDTTVWNITSKRLIVVTIDSLILHQENLNKNNLPELINSYCKQVDSLSKKIMPDTMDALISKFPSFDSFLNNKFKNKLVNNIYKEIKSVIED